MTFGVHYYDKKGREVTGTQFYKTACEERDAEIAALQEQVQKLAAEANYLRDEIKQHSESVHFCEVCGKDDPCKTDDVCYALSHPLSATDAVIREIGAKAVEYVGNKCTEVADTLDNDSLFTTTCAKHKFAATICGSYAAKLRAGEQP